MPREKSGPCFLRSTKPIFLLLCLKRPEEETVVKHGWDAAIESFPRLDVDDEARVLAEKIILRKAIPGEYPEDALHIAVAAVNGMEVILTWNFAHLNNPFTRRMVRQVVEGEGYECPEICSPEELLEVDG